MFILHFRISTTIASGQNICSLSVLANARAVSFFRGRAGIFDDVSAVSFLLTYGYVSKNEKC